VGANCEQLRSDMIAEGYITQEEVDQDVAALDDPEMCRTLLSSISHLLQSDPPAKKGK
jgi:hypothetical protein